MSGGGRGEWGNVSGVGDEGELGNMRGEGGVLS